MVELTRRKLLAGALAGGGVTAAAALGYVQRQSFQGTEPITVPTRGGTVQSTRNLPDAIGSADYLIWVAADSQHGPQDGNDANSRIEHAADDLASLPTPDHLILPGDLSNPQDIGRQYDDKAAIQNIAESFRGYTQIPWYNETSKTIVAGNHEWGYLKEFGDTFGACTEPDTACRQDLKPNITTIALATNPGRPVVLDSAIDTVEKHIESLSKTDTNVILTLHQPIPGTVSNCHVKSSDGDIFYLDRNSARRLRDLAASYPDTVAATITGHIHGRHRNESTWIYRGENQAYIDAPLFGGGTLWNPSKETCDGPAGDVGLTDSLFVGFWEGDTKVSLAVRYHCDDYNRNGECDIGPRWGPTTAIEFPNPLNMD